MKIYIASSWRNKHGVQMLTDILRNNGHEVISWIENCQLEGVLYPDFSFEDWVNTDQADSCFMFDTDGIINSDILVYYCPAGKDACVEVGIAFASGLKVLGLSAKGEDLGLMRKCISVWFDSVPDLLLHVNEIVYPISDDLDLPF